MKYFSFEVLKFKNFKIRSELFGTCFRLITRAQIVGHVPLIIWEMFDQLICPKRRLEKRTAKLFKIGPRPNRKVYTYVFKCTNSLSAVLI